MGRELYSKTSKQVGAAMKEKYVWLSSKELQLMLQGSLQWNDISPRVSSSKAGMRKLGESIDKPSLAQQPQQTGEDFSLGKSSRSKPIEGQPVIWLLGSVGLLTLSSWFYFVIFSK